MPANIVCPCGHTVKVPDEQVKTRIKCPVCGELLSTHSALPENESAVTSVPPLGHSSRTPSASVTSPKSANENSSESTANTMASGVHPDQHPAFTRKADSFLPGYRLRRSSPNHR